MPRIWIAYLFGFVPVFGAIAYGYNFTDYSWVSRFGAFTVMAGIWLTFKTFEELGYVDLIGSYNDERNIYKQTDSQRRDKEVLKLKSDPLTKKKYLFAEKLLLFSGTFIWAFGDLLGLISNQKIIIYSLALVFIVFFVWSTLVRMIRLSTD